MIRVVHVGLGEIGKATIDALAAQSSQMNLVGAVDTHPGLAGRNLREIMGGRRDVPSLTVWPSLGEALKKVRIDVATLTTGSRTAQIKETLEALMESHVHVVSTCEELAFPKFHAPKIAAELDRTARKQGVVILGTGVNPGFAMDAFALACTAPCARVTHIKVVRSLDASGRRQQLQKKVGAGMSVVEVKKLIRQRRIGHVGLAESCAMIAAGLGWKLEQVREKFEPVIADHAVASEFYHVEPGQVRGMRMTADGIVSTKAGRKKLIELDLTMAFDADTFDEVIIDGAPPLLVRTKSGFPGDASTAGLLVNCARIAPTLAPGLRTMIDVLKVRSVGA